MNRITIICCHSLMQPANHAMVLLGKAPALNTYQFAGRRCPDDCRYAVSSGIWTDGQIAGMGNPDILSDPDLAPLFIANGGIVDPAMITQAQSALVIWDGTGDVPLAVPAVILALSSSTAAEARGQIIAAGLTRLPDTSDPLAQ